VLPAKTKRPKASARRTGRNAIPPHLEAEEHRFRPPGCEHCGSTELTAADELVEEKLHVVKEHQRRRVVRRTTCRCRDCGRRTTPPSLPAPYARSKMTCEWLAWFVHQKFGLLVPLDRIRRDLAERGVPLAMGSIVSFVERAADLLAPIDGLHWKTLLSSAWMATDGTGLKVLVPGLPAAHDGYVELYRNADCAVFQYAAHKGGEDLVDKLTSFRGTLTAGGERGKVYVITPAAAATWSISVLPTTGLPDAAPASGSGINKRFRYLPTLDGFVLLPQRTSSLYFLRTR
jgi:transposase